MSLESRTGWLLRADAVMSWALALPGLLDPADAATFFGAEDPTYSFLVRLWSGLLFLLGCLSWEASRNPRAGTGLLKYVWIQKAFVTVTVLCGHLDGEAPPSLMVLVMLTHMAWVPPLLYSDVALRRRVRASASTLTSPQKAP